MSCCTSTASEYTWKRTYRNFSEPPKMKAFQKQRQCTLQEKWSSKLDQHETMPHELGSTHSFRDLLYRSPDRFRKSAVLQWKWSQLKDRLLFKASTILRKLRFQFQIAMRRLLTGHLQVLKCFCNELDCTSQQSRSCTECRCKWRLLLQTKLCHQGSSIQCSWTTWRDGRYKTLLWTTIPRMLT